MTRAEMAIRSPIRILVPRCLLASGLCAVLLALTASAVRSADLCSSPYFSVAAGPKLQYKTTYDIGEEPPVTYTQTFTNVSGDGFTQHLDFADGGMDRAWKCTAAGLVADEYLSLTAPQRRTQLEIRSTGGVTLPPPDQWKKGQTWEQSFAVRDRAPSEEHGETKGTLTIKYEIAEPETVTVPAGKFEALKVYVLMKQDLSVIKGDQTYPMDNVVAALAWYAKDVGLVKATSETVATSELISVTK